MTEERIAALQRQLKAKAVNPRDVKADLATELVTMYHSAEAAARAKAEFFKVFSRREAPSEMPTRVLQADATGAVNFVELLVAEGLAKTKNEARRLLRQKAVKLNNSPLSKTELRLADSSGVLQVGSRQFRRLVVPSQETQEG